MKKLILTLTLVASVSPISAFAFNLNDYESNTQVAHKYVTGALDQRMIELGQNFQTKEFNVIVGRTQKIGTERYCTFYFRSIGSDVKGCARTITVPHADGTSETF